MLGERERRDAAEHEAEEHQAQSLPEHQLQHRRARGAERHADAELLRSLVDGKRDHAGEAGGGDEQRDPANTPISVAVSRGADSDAERTSSSVRN